MIERKIRLTDTEEVKDFVRAAGKCDFDIDIFLQPRLLLMQNPFLHPQHGSEP